jgi:hypothetical protein
MCRLPAGVSAPAMPHLREVPPAAACLPPPAALALCLTVSPCVAQFFHLGKLPAMDPAEAYQPDTRLRLGLGVKAAGVGGKAVSAGAQAGCCEAACLAGAFWLAAMQPLVKRVMT